MIIKVADHIGTNAITIYQGEIIYNLIKDSTNIVLDFEGINHLAAPFANFSVGRLLEHKTLEEFYEQVKIINLNKKCQYKLFELVVENNNRYYRDANYRQAVDKSIEEKSQEDYDWH